MNERELIAYIAGQAGQAGGDLLMGIGDDCAVIRRDESRVWLLTMDTLIESVHFDSVFHPPDKLGRKAVSVNVSDIAAMGGSPAFALLSVGMPPGFDQHWFTEFAKGITSACNQYGCLLVGGDTVASPRGITLTLTLIGEAEAEAVIYRHGAQPGDDIWVSGALGQAAAGLALLRRDLETANPEFAPLREKHLNPQARVGLGRQLAQSGIVHAMMDLSDGLATDLAHLCKQSGVGGRIVAASLPGLAALAPAARLTGDDPVQWAISGGEDYELLFTADPGQRERIRTIGRACGLELTPVGTIVPGSGVVLADIAEDGRVVEQAVAYQGFDHFPAAGRR